MEPKLILINGLPGVGKTTLQKRLAQDLNLPAMGKDTIKEFLFDELGVRDREWSRNIGIVAIDMLHILCERLLLNGETIIIENAFYKSFAAPRFKELCEQHNIPLVEIYCFTDNNLRIERYKKRSINGERHPGHADFDNFKDLDNMATTANYEPLEIGELLRYDTTYHNQEQYQKLLTQIRHFLAIQ